MRVEGVSVVVSFDYTSKLGGEGGGQRCDVSFDHSAEGGSELFVSVVLFPLTITISLKRGVVSIVSFCHTVGGKVGVSVVVSFDHTGKSGARGDGVGVGGSSLVSALFDLRPHSPLTKPVNLGFGRLFGRQRCCLSFDYTRMTWCECG